MTALLVGTVLALGTLSFVLFPLFAGTAFTALAPSSGQLPAAETRRNAAIEALREIEFDKETGKLSDADYETLRSTYTQRAVEVMRAGDGAACPRCGPRPERDAVFCSTCGAPIAA